MAQKKTENSEAITPPKPPSSNTSRKAIARKAPLKSAAKPSHKPVARVTTQPPHVAPPPKSAKSVKVKKARLIRDSFTMPDTEYALISMMKKRCLAKGVAVRKSELLRAAIAGLADLDDQALLIAVRRIEIIKPGRVTKSKK